MRRRLVAAGVSRLGAQNAARLKPLREEWPEISPNLDQPVVVRPMLTAANAAGGAAR